VHSIGFAPREAIAGNFLDGLTRENFRIAHDISAYSFPAMAKAALPYLNNNRIAADTDLPGRRARGAQLQHHGPGQGVAGIVGALPGRGSGPSGMRVNGLSAGAIKTLAASGIKDFGKLLGISANASPLRRNVTIDEVGNVAAFPAQRPGLRHDRPDLLCGLRREPVRRGRLENP
jgi:enoyl-[acyl-carrier protein] reductase I